MYGYVKPYREELTVRLDGLYRALYCGLCHAMAKTTGAASTLTVSYDLVFLAAVRMALTGEEIRLFRRRCARHPVKPRTVAAFSPALRYAAAASAVLTAEKLRDDKADEGGAGRLRAGLLLPPADRMSRRGGLPGDLINSVRKHLGDLRALEAEQSPSVDDVADCFGRVLGELFSADLPDAERRIAYEIGFRTGRFVYLIDALDDGPADKRLGRYNPILAAWGDGALTEDGKRLSPAVTEAGRDAIRLSLGRLGAAVELLPTGDLGELIRNIVYLGMPNGADRVLCGPTGRGKKENERER